jgi:hypothetical protein
MAITTKQQWQEFGLHEPNPGIPLTDSTCRSNLMRVQVEAMRRSAALVGAITLLTACSSGDIVVKTDLDESYVVKDSAVTEIKSPIDNRIAYQEQLIRIEKENINDAYSGSKECKRRHPILSQAQCDKIYFEPIPKYKEEIKTIEKTIKFLKKVAASEDPWIKQVKYRPIFIDLNDKKRAMGYVTLTCLNPNIESKDAAKLFKALGETLEDVDPRKAYYSAGSKVCQKYAYTDGGVFAYREAKKSDESKESD